MPGPIRRTLAYFEDHRQEWSTIGDDELPALRKPIVILGDPGLGKSVLTKTLGAIPGMKRFPAGTFMRCPHPDVLIDEGDRIIVDGLDEIVSAYPGAGVHAVLGKLSQMGYPLFILSCRDADWRGAADRAQIRDDYQVPPLLLHLQPFDLDDAQTFLADQFPVLDSGKILDHLASRGLDGVYQNPLTLRLIGEVAHNEGPLPDSRAELLERACAVMLIEDNPHHHPDPHAHRNDEELLLAAGAICATQLLCDRTGVFTGAKARTPDGAVHLAEFHNLPFAEAASDALRTRLFQAEGEGVFSHVHRVVAEFLGARWLARCAADGSSERRIFSLFRPGDGIPTSLRGLHAWIAHFDVTLANRCIAADPYGLLRYGDAETIAPEQARSLLTALRALSEADPYFASDDRRRLPASGLMRPELRDEIRAILNAPDRSLNLSVLLLNAIVGTGLAVDMAAELHDMVLDPGWTYHERLCAADALRASGTVDDWEVFLHRLLVLGDSDSARLTCELLTEIGAGAVSIATSVEAVLSHLGMTVPAIRGDERRVTRHIRGELFRDLQTPELIDLLDTLSLRVEPLLNEADHTALAALADLVRRLTVQLLEAGAVIQPEQVWSWLRPHDGRAGHAEDVKRELAARLRRAPGLRTALLEHVLLTPCAENTWMAGHRLRDLLLDLHPTHEDLVHLLGAVRRLAGDGSIDEETWRGLLLLGRTVDGLPEAVRGAAMEASNGEPRLIETLNELSDSPIPDWMLERERREAEAEAERQAIFQSHRDSLIERLEPIASGDYRILQAPAEAYLGRWNHSLDRALPPEVRLHDFLGAGLATAVLEGFIVVLGRTDLPSAADITGIRVERQYYLAELPMICGVAEMIRQGLPLDAVERGTLAAVYMAWWRLPESGNEGLIDIGPVLEEILFVDDLAAEEHYRTSIEPQLEAGLDNIDELYRLIHGERRAVLAGQLSVDWLQRYRDLPFDLEKMLVSCAVDKAPDELRRQVDIRERIAGAADGDRRLLWLSAAYVVEFEHHRDDLLAAAAGEPGFIWRIRDRFGEGAGGFSALSFDQLRFVVEALAVHFPNVPTPVGIIRGDQNPWQASRFVGQAIFAIASRPTPEATEALQRLIDGPAQSYANAARHALAEQRKARRDSEYVAPSLGELQSVMADGVPESVDGMRAYLLDELDSLQKRVQASNTNMWQAYWMHQCPRDENFCRDRLVEHLSGPMPRAIQIEPEARMPEGRRTDFVLSHDGIRLPIEIKGQWHRKVWDAATEQLDAFYAREVRAQGRGVYIVLWCGDVPGKRLPRHPEGLPTPDTPEALCQMLIDRLPESRRSQIDVFVMNVSPPQ